MEIRLLKARDGVYDLFFDGEWKMSTRKPEKIFECLNEFHDFFEFYYIDMNGTIDCII